MYYILLENGFEFSHQSFHALLKGKFKEKKSPPRTSHRLAKNINCKIFSSNCKLCNWKIYSAQRLKSISWVVLALFLLLAVFGAGPSALYYNIVN